MFPLAKFTALLFKMLRILLQNMDTRTILTALRCQGVELSADDLKMVPGAAAVQLVVADDVR